MLVGPQQDQRLNIPHHTKQGLPAVCLLKLGEAEMNRVFFVSGLPHIYVKLVH
jgi:hypothetical protein